LNLPTRSSGEDQAADHLSKSDFALPDYYLQR
jgi:hypothetical protein